MACDEKLRGKPCASRKEAREFLAERSFYFLLQDNFVNEGLFSDSEEIRESGSMKGDIDTYFPVTKAWKSLDYGPIDYPLE